MKNVLMIAYYFPPSGVSGIYRTMRFIKFLPACGWRPVVLTLRPDAYEAGEPRDDSLYERLPRELTVIRMTELRVLEVQRLCKLRRRTATQDVAPASQPLHQRREAAGSWWQRCKDAVTGALSTLDRQIGWGCRRFGPVGRRFDAMIFTCCIQPVSLGRPISWGMGCGN